MKKQIWAIMGGIMAVMLCFLLECEINAAEEIKQETESTDGSSTVIPMYDIPALQLGVEETYKVNPYNDYDSLSLPAQITLQGNYYFIVDTYHNQVLYASDLKKPLQEWRVMDRKMNKPHAIASDGTVYLVADTDNNRVLCYEYVNGRFQNTQRFDEIGIRPHYIQYDAETESFFVWSSVTGDMYIIKRLPEYNYMYIKEIRHINELDGFYVRSFSIDGDEVLFPSGNNQYMITAEKETLRVKERYQVPPQICGMAFAKKIGNYYYMTISTDEKLSHKNACIIRTTDLSLLMSGLYEDVTDCFAEVGVPYYIDKINGSYYMTSHNSRKCVYRFNVVQDMLINIETMH